MTFPLRSSSISQYLECPKRAFFVYVDRKPHRTNPAMALGTMTHAGIEAALRAVIAGEPLSESVAVEAAATSCPADVDWTGQDDEREPIALRAAAFARTYVREVAPSVKPVDVERYVSTKIGSIDVSGTIDVVESNRIRDTKTTRRMPTPWGDPKHRFQLGLYAALVETACFDSAPQSAVIDYLVLSERKPRATKSNPEPTTERTVRYLPVVLDAADLADEKRSAIDALHMVHERTQCGEYPRNPNACMSWGRPCEFLAECYPHRARMVEIVKSEAEQGGNENG